MNRSIYGINYNYRGHDKGAFYFVGFWGWPVFDCPDFDHVRLARFIRVYTYPSHSPCYYIKNKYRYYKHGVLVSSEVTEWRQCKVKEFLASYDSINLISDVCGIRLYRGAWV